MITLPFIWLILPAYEKHAGESDQLGAMAIQVKVLPYQPCMVMVLPSIRFFMVFLFLQSNINLWRI